MWRRWAVSVVLLAGLLAGCSDDDSSGQPGSSTTRDSGGSGATTSTAPAPDSRFLGASFLTDQEGWGLSREPCPRPGADQAQCGAMSHTTDGGDSWTRLGRIEVSTDAASGTDFISAVHFADSQHGWAYYRTLVATFNGGKRWQRVDLGTPVVALDSLGSQAYALVGSCPDTVGDCAGPIRLAEGTLASGRWRFASLGFDLPPTDTGSIVASRSGVYALIAGDNLEQTFLARPGNGRWERRTLPCARALITAIQGEDGLVAACRPAASAGPTELQTSSDGGRTWALVWQQTFPSPVVSLAVTPDAALVGLENGNVLRSVDNGMHFSVVLETDSTPRLQFTDGQHGFVTAGPASGRRLFSTKDGGASWQPVKTPG